MPTLDFKGKQLVYAHHLTVPSRTLEPDAQKSLPPKGSKPSLDDNLIIHGDNLHALKALMPRYQRRRRQSQVHMRIRQPGSELPSLSELHGIAPQRPGTNPPNSLSENCAIHGALPA